MATPFPVVRARLDRALAARDLAAVRAVARERPSIVTLADAVDAPVLMLDADDPAFDDAAVRWIARFTSECAGATLGETHAALEARGALPAPDAQATLPGLLKRHGVGRARPWWLRSALRTSETRLVAADDSDSPAAVIAALAEATNAHDIDAFVALFADDYDSQQPAHPDRAFRGRDQVRANWSEVFAGVSDFRADLVATAVEGDCVWSEWRWRGTHADGSRLGMAGVIIFGVRAGRIVWARLYVEPVEEEGEGIEAAVRDMSGRR